MANPLWLDVSDAISNLATTVGILIGGGWAFYRFALVRERESALEIDLAHTTAEYDARNYLVHLDVKLTNKGKVHLTACNRTPAYEEPGVDRIDYGADLLLRKIATSLPAGHPIRWWPERDAKSPDDSDIHIDLLGEYELNGQTDFWMEPGETQHMAAVAILAPGNYLAMVTFVGKNQEEEFWRRVFVVSVPQSTAATTSGAAPTTPKSGGSNGC